MQQYPSQSSPPGQPGHQPAAMQEKGGGGCGKAALIIAIVIAVLVLLAVLLPVVMCGGCAACMGVAGVAAEAEQQEIANARSQCQPPNTFRVKEGGLRSSADGWECATPDQIATEQQAIEAARANCKAPMVYRTIATKSPAFPGSWECVNPAEVPSSPPGGSSPASPSSGGAAPAASVHGLDDEFSVGDFSYQITKISSRRRVGNRLVSQTASEGAVYVVVEYRERNDGDTQYQGMGDPVGTLRDARGRNFTPTPEATTALAMSGREGGMQSLPPGIWRSGVVAFEVPEDVAQGEVDLIVTGRGLFSGGREVVRVQIPGS